MQDNFDNLVNKISGLLSYTIITILILLNLFFFVTKWICLSLVFSSQSSNIILNKTLLTTPRAKKKSDKIDATLRSHISQAGANPIKEKKDESRPQFPDRR
jgi:hypothetical protein